MSDDLRTVLERDVERVAPPGFGMDELANLRRRAERNRRLRAGGAGLVVALVVVIAITRLAGMGSSASVPANAPTDPPAGAPSKADTPGIWALDPSTGSTRLVFGPPWLSPPGEQRFGTFVDAAVLSPDGTRVAFVLERSGFKGFELSTVTSEGKDLTRVVHCDRQEFLCPSWAGGWATYAWSPDGTRIAFLGGPNTRSNPSDVYAVDLRTGVTSLLAGGPGEDGYVTWSPDGSRLAVGREGDIVVHSLVDGSATTIAAGIAPEWSPDGRWIAYINAVEADGPLGIWLIRPDGTDAHHVAPGWEPVSWAPDGSTFAVPTVEVVNDPTVGVPRSYRIVDVKTGDVRTIVVDAVEGVQIYLDWGSTAAP